MTRRNVKPEPEFFRDDAPPLLSNVLKKPYTHPELIVLDVYNINGGVASLNEGSGGVIQS